MENIDFKKKFLSLIGRKFGGGGEAVHSCFSIPWTRLKTIKKNLNYLRYIGRFRQTAEPAWQ